MSCKHKRQFAGDVLLPCAQPQCGPGELDGYERHKSVTVSRAPISCVERVRTFWEWRRVEVRT